MRLAVTNRIPQDVRKALGADMKLDLDALEFSATDGIPVFAQDAEVLALIRIARAAVAWRDAVDCEDEAYDCERPLYDALREAGL